MIVDSVSNLNLYLKGNSSYTGAINSSGQQGGVYVEIESGSTWTLTGDSYITSLTCAEGAVNLNGHSLYVNGVKYTGSASTGQAIETTVASSSSGSGNGAPDGKPGEKPDGNPPAKPERIDN